MKPVGPDISETRPGIMAEMAGEIRKEVVAIFETISNMKNPARVEMYLRGIRDGMIERNRVIGNIEKR
jgi:hypothetical protein